MIVDKELLVKALKVMKKVILDSGGYPVLNNAIFSKENCIRMYSGRYDSEELDLQIKFPGIQNNIGNTPFLMPVKILASLCGVPEKKKKGRKKISLVELVPNENKDNVSIVFDGIRTKMDVDNVDDYPVEPMVIPDKGKTFRVVDVSKFVEAIKFVRKAIYKWYDRHNLTHMQIAWSNSESETIACCTDGHRLAKAPVFLFNEGYSAKEIKFTMSNMFIELLLTSIVAAGKKVTVEIFQKERDENKSSKSDSYKYDRIYAKIVGDIEIEIAGNVCEYAFPDVNMVIPNFGKCETVLVLDDLSKFESALKRASKLGEKGDGIIFEATKDMLSLTTNNRGSESVTELDVKVERLCSRKEKENEDAEFETVQTRSRTQLNPAYVLDAVTGESCDMIFMEYGDVLTPVIFQNDDGFLGLVMPMRIENSNDE
ncbi:MAG: hypothetical protein ACTSYJ_00540 [Candidatus Thorarchaeota archaeon]